METQMKYVGIDQLIKLNDFSYGWGIWVLKYDNGYFYFLDRNTMNVIDHRISRDIDPSLYSKLTGFARIFIRDVFKHELLWIS